MAMAMAMANPKQLRIISCPGCRLEMTMEPSVTSAQCPTCGLVFTTSPPCQQQQQPVIYPQQPPPQQEAPPSHPKQQGLRFYQAPPPGQQQQEPPLPTLGAEPLASLYGGPSTAVVADTVSSGPNTIHCDLYENERWYPMIGYKAKFLPTDRKHYSSKDGKQETRRESFVLNAGYQWANEWYFIINPGKGEGQTDNQGWEYAMDFSKAYHGEKKKTSVVRRRLWRRTMQRAPPSQVKPRMTSFTPFVGSSSRVSGSSSSGGAKNMNENDDDKVSRLMEMGIGSKAECLDALQHANGNVQIATGILLGEAPPVVGRVSSTAGAPSGSGSTTGYGGISGYATTTGRIASSGGVDSATPSGSSGPAPTIAEVMPTAEEMRADGLKARAMDLQRQNSELQARLKAAESTIAAQNMDLKNAEQKNRNSAAAYRLEVQTLSLEVVDDHHKRPVVQNQQQQQAQPEERTPANDGPKEETTNDEIPNVRDEARPCPGAQALLPPASPESAETKTSEKNTLLIAQEEKRGSIEALEY